MRALILQLDLTFEQQKAELKRKILAQPPKRQKVKKQKKDTVYNPESKQAHLALLTR